MSVIIRRARAQDGFAENEKLSEDLQKCKSLLEIFVIEGEGGRKGVDLYAELVFLTLALVNTALSDRLQSPRHQTIAKRAATITLSLVSSLHDLFPDVNHLAERDLTYARALADDMQLVQRLISAAHQGLVNVLRTPRRPSNSYGNMEARAWDALITQAHESFERKMSFFMLDENLSVRRGRRRLLEEADAPVLEWDEVALGNQHNPLPDMKGSFWDKTFQAVVRGQPVVVKTYTPATFQDFRRDLEMMTTHRHSHLPALFGRSSGRSSVPFIAMAASSTMSLVDYASLTCETRPRTAVGDLWKTFISIEYAAEYLFKHGICSYNDDLHETLKAIVVNHAGKAILAPSFRQPRKSGSFPKTPLSLADIPYDVKFLYEATFGTAEGHDGIHSTPSPIARHGSKLRPLYYALMENPSAALHSSLADSVDIFSQRLALARWRPKIEHASSGRDMPCPVPDTLTSLENQPLVGDIGYISYDANGTPAFTTFSNVREQLGGYLLAGSSGKSLSDNNWLLLDQEPSIPFPHVCRHAWTREIPIDVALNYLSINARRLAKQYNIETEDLALLSSVALMLESRPDANYPYIFARFDRQGQLLETHRSSSPVASQVAAYRSSEILDPTLRIRQLVRCVHIEEDELASDQNAESSSLHALDASLGDMGYSARSPDGGRVFHVVHNSAPDFQEVVVEAWEGNDSQEIDSGIWRLPIMDCNTSPPLCFAWKTTSRTGVPPDVDRAFIYDRLVSHDDDAYPTPARSDVGRVEKTYYQVHISPDMLLNRTGPIQFDVLFGLDGKPKSIAMFGDPTDPSAERVWLSSDDWHYKAYPQITWHGEYWNILSRLHARYRSIKRPPPRPPSQNQSPRVGDVGYWVRDPAESLPNKWVALGRVKVSQEATRELKHTSSSSTPCIRLSENLWQSERLKSFSESYHQRYDWVEELSCDVVVDSAGLLSNLAGKASILPNEILIVTQLTTTVHATHYLDTRTKIYPLDYDWSAKPRLYVAFSSEGGCYPYWSCHQHTSVNHHMLAKLNLDTVGLVVPNCATRVNFDVELKPLAGLFPQRPINDGPVASWEAISTNNM